ncbi:hypothetical protein C8R45DRAFT_1042664 [Mycena sanguinolenta]|nr:hypothetical protein C8R45DRAFT_1042664 [Mycena sanguinolenta]
MRMGWDRSTRASSFALRFQRMWSRFPFSWDYLLASRPLLAMLFRPPLSYPPSSFVSSSQAPPDAHSYDVPVIVSISLGFSIPRPLSLLTVPRPIRLNVLRLGSLRAFDSFPMRLNSATATLLSSLPLDACDVPRLRLTRPGHFVLASLSVTKT